MSLRSNENNSEAQVRNKNWKDAYKKMTNLRRWGSKKNRSKHGDEESQPDEDFTMIIRANPHRPPSPYPEKSCAVGITSWPSNIAKDPNRKGPHPWSRTEEEMFGKRSPQSFGNFFSSKVKQCIIGEHDQRHESALPANSSGQPASTRTVPFSLEESSSALSTSRTPARHPVLADPGACSQMPFESKVLVRKSQWCLFYLE
ncbi:hypothetical protein N7540_000783 [Penicillium herquei]|nr:hypothetical protein N7540_000783 [Penicillium herquei]